MSNVKMGKDNFIKTSWGLVLDFPENMKIFITDLCKECQKDHENNFVKCLQIQDYEDRLFYCENVAVIPSKYEESKSHS